MSRVHKFNTKVITKSINKLQPKIYQEYTSTMYDRLRVGLDLVPPVPMLPLVLQSLPSLRRHGIYNALEPS